MITRYLNEEVIMAVRGDKSKRVGSCKKSAGPAATKKSVAKTPRGKPVVMAGGAKAYHKWGDDD